MGSINVPVSLDAHQYLNTGRLFAEAVRMMTTQNMVSWTRTKNQDGRLPLMTAADISLKWRDIERIFDAHRPAIYETDDAVTGLPVSLLAAVGQGSDLES